MARRPPRQRLDALVLARGIAPDLRRAAALVLAGEIIVGEQRVDKPGQLVPADAALRHRPRNPHPYVSRGGTKLAGALDHFQLSVRDLVALDLGASTGGFTDCLLQRGAQRVYAVDVGYGLLDWRLQTHPQVVNLERTHAADLTAQTVPEPIDLIVADISFNSLTRLLAPAIARLAPEGQALLLVKPQFEAAASQIGEGGIVRDPEVWRAACTRVGEAVEALGLIQLGQSRSVITGTQGNVEFWLHARRPTAALD